MTDQDRHHEWREQRADDRGGMAVVTFLAITLFMLAAVLPFITRSAGDQVRPVPGKQSYSETIADAIRRGGTVYLEARAEPYVIDNLVIDRPVRLVGYGAALRIREDWTDRETMGLTLRAPVVIEGLTVIAGGSYAAISVESSGCVLEGVAVLDYAYKGIRVAFDDADGWFEARRCYAESDRGNGSSDYDGGGVYPVAYQIDAGPGRMIGRVLMADCVAGPHPNTTSGGQCVKLATVRQAVVERFDTAGETDPRNSNTLILAERLGSVTVRDSRLRRGIVHYPDQTTDPAGFDVEHLLIENTTLGGDDAPQNLHYHVRARRLVYRGVRVVGIDNTALIDETPGPCWRRFEDVTFDTTRAVASHGRWQPQVYFAAKGVEPAVVWSGVELTDGLRWSLDEELTKQYEGSN